MTTVAGKKWQRQSEENIEGKKKKITVLNCIECKKKPKIVGIQKECVDCVINKIYQIRHKRIDSIRVERWNYGIESEYLAMFRNFFVQTKNIRKEFRKIEKNLWVNCSFKRFNCRRNKKLKSSFHFIPSDFKDPIKLYLKVSGLIVLLKESKKVKGDACEKCFNYIKKTLKNAFSSLKECRIIEEFNNFKSESEVDATNYLKFYDYIFQNNGIFHKKSSQTLEHENYDLSYPCETYFLGDFEAFKISIFNIKGESEKIYRVNKYYDYIPERSYFETIQKDLIYNLREFLIDDIIPLEDLIDGYMQEAEQYLGKKYNLLSSNIQKISFLAVIKKINLEKIFPLLIDDYIEEIFLDNLVDPIYINHQKHHRCRTEIQLNLQELDRFKTFLRLYSGKRLDFSSPSIKYVIKNKYFFCRFSIDIEPVQINSCSFDIRKLNRNILTIQDLLKNQTLSPKIAAFLYFLVLRRINITTAGQTDTGKTTLINSLDLLTPKDFRKIYIENVTESLEELRFGKHQLKYRADSLEEGNDKEYSKSNQIKRLLHRSPDIIYLGEILTKEEAEAMFHCLSAGLKGFQTIHANSTQSLLNRFLYHFEINKTCLEDLDIIILMKKKNNLRRIITISEIKDNLSDDKRKLINLIYKYNPDTEDWDNLVPLYQTTTVKKIKQYEFMSESLFNSILNYYEVLFEKLQKIERLENKDLIELFHKVSFHSLYSPLSKLEKFLNSWKN